MPPGEFHVHTILPDRKTLSLLTWRGRNAKATSKNREKRVERRENEKGEGACGTWWWSFRDHRARDPTALKGSPTLFFETRNRGSFRVTLLDAAKTTRDSLESCAHACAKIWSGANASSLHLHFADVKIAPGPLIRICIFEASRGALPFP